MTTLRQAAESLRTEVRACLPENAFLQLDRSGGALFVTPAHGADIASLQRCGWVCEPARAMLKLSPGLAHLEKLRPLAAADPLTACFAQRPPDPGTLPLFAAILSAVLLPPAPSARARLDKQLRQAMALALRTGSGGGLELCHSLFILIQTQ